MRVCAGCANRNEATAFADAENEYLIQRALDILLHGKTVLMIAHRLQTIVHADQIIVMQRGGIAEQGYPRGTHAAAGRVRKDVSRI